MLITVVDGTEVESGSGENLYRVRRKVRVGSGAPAAAPRGRPGLPVPRPESRGQSAQAGHPRPGSGPQDPWLHTVALGDEWSLITHTNSGPTRSLLDRIKLPAAPIDATPPAADTAGTSIHCATGPSRALARVRTAPPAPGARSSAASRAGHRSDSGLVQVSHDLTRPHGRHCSPNYSRTGGETLGGPDPWADDRVAACRRRRGQCGYAVRRRWC